MNHPNQLEAGAMMNLNQYFLVKIAEEASEVAQIALKAAHFGLSEIQPGRAETNAERVYAELNDLLAMVHRLGEVSSGEFWFDIGSPDHAAIATKLAKVEHYLAYSQSLGLVEVPPCAVTTPAIDPTLRVRLDAANAALDAVVNWTKQEGANDEMEASYRLLALLANHGVHPR
jgi:hypothetical protein